MKDKLAFYMHENKKYDKFKKSLKKKLTYRYTTAIINLAFDALTK